MHFTIFQAPFHRFFVPVTALASANANIAPWGCSLGEGKTRNKKPIKNQIVAGCSVVKEASRSWWSARISEEQDKGASQEMTFKLRSEWNQGQEGGSFMQT